MVQLRGWRGKVGEANVIKDGVESDGMVSRGRMTHKILRITAIPHLSNTDYSTHILHAQMPRRALSPRASSFSLTTPSRGVEERKEGKRYIKEKDKRE